MLKGNGLHAAQLYIMKIEQDICVWLQGFCFGLLQFRTNPSSGKKSPLKSENEQI